MFVFIDIVYMICVCCVYCRCILFVSTCCVYTSVQITPPIHDTGLGLSGKARLSGVCVYVRVCVCVCKRDTE